MTGIDSAFMSSREVKVSLFCQDGDTRTGGDGADMPHWDGARVGFYLERQGFLFRDGEQQPAAGLGVVEQGLKVDGKLAINGDVRAEVKEVIRRSAGESVG